MNLAWCWCVFVWQLTIREEEMARCRRRWLREVLVVGASCSMDPTRAFKAAFNVIKKVSGSLRLLHWCPVMWTSCHYDGHAVKKKRLFTSCVKEVLLACVMLFYVNLKKPCLYSVCRTTRGLERRRECRLLSLCYMLKTMARNVFSSWLHASPTGTCWWARSFLLLKEVQGRCRMTMGGLSPQNYHSYTLSSSGVCKSQLQMISRLAGMVILRETVQKLQVIRTFTSFCRTLVRCHSLQSPNWAHVRYFYTLCASCFCVKCSYTALQGQEIVYVPNIRSDYRVVVFNKERHVRPSACGSVKPAVTLFVQFRPYLLSLWWTDCLPDKLVAASLAACEIQP